jgi:hypothetical protein
MDIEMERDGFEVFVLFSLRGLSDEFFENAHQKNAETLYFHKKKKEHTFAKRIL